MATAQLPPSAFQPHAFAEYAAAQTSASIVPTVSDGNPLQSPAGRGHAAYAHHGNTTRTGHGMPEERPLERRRQGALPIADLLLQEPSPSTRPGTIPASRQGSSRPSVGPAAPAQAAPGRSPIETHGSPTAARRPFFDPARSLADTDVSMSDAPTPLTTTFPTTGYSTGFHADPSPSSPDEYVPP